MSHFPFPVEDIDGNENDAELDAGQIHVDHLDRIDQVNAQAVSRSHASGHQSVRQAITARLDLSKREFPALELKRHLVPAADQR